MLRSFYNPPPRERAPGTHWIGGWAGPRAGLGAVVKGKIPSPCGDSNPLSSSPYAIMKFQENQAGLWWKTSAAGVRSQWAEMYYHIAWHKLHWTLVIWLRKLRTCSFLVTRMQRKIVIRKWLLNPLKIRTVQIFGNYSNKWRLHARRS
jgi:hypothetical protein